eukprot:TRINITY_DN5591_c0_g1_i1.p1 TRINITY_DN5591_c0_g1~~TRINITY_DN5591_c0_g1_i1.p1  ORF type:complete len:286 (-),score=10.07 TRINITY_DN5591_c0_g1_i1:89-946(-)
MTEPTQGAEPGWRDQIRLSKMKRVQELRTQGERMRAVTERLNLLSQCDGGSRSRIAKELRQIEGFADEQKKHEPRCRTARPLHCTPPQGATANRRNSSTCQPPKNSQPFLRRHSAGASAPVVIQRSPSKLPEKLSSKKQPVSPAPRTVAGRSPLQQLSNRQSPQRQCGNKQKSTRNTAPNANMPHITSPAKHPALPRKPAPIEHRPSVSNVAEPIRPPLLRAHDRPASHEDQEDVCREFSTENCEQGADETVAGAQHPSLSIIQPFAISEPKVHAPIARPVGPRR